jgi:hypothetical protein
MKPRCCILVASAAALASCLVPASVFERASFPTVPPLERPDYWQSQGRYRQEPAAEENRAVPAEPVASAAAQPPGVAPQPFAQPPLLGWDGGVVDGAPSGSVSAEGQPAHGLEPSPAGRMHIIELYQRVLDERDSLAGEVETLARTLEETQGTLAAERARSADLETRLAALEASHQSTLGDNRELAARLATAQIRRLEAEKLLLETKLEGLRARAAQEAAPAETKPAEKPAARKGIGE